MGHEDELRNVREQVSILAEQMARLTEIIASGNNSGRDMTMVEERLALLEALMWKLHRRHGRLKAHAALANATLAEMYGYRPSSWAARSAK
jgi:hypothetical protein